MTLGQANISQVGYKMWQIYTKIESVIKILKISLTAFGMPPQISWVPLLSRVSQLEWDSQALCRDE